MTSTNEGINTMNLETSINSMSPELMAESLEVMARGNIGFREGGDGKGELTRSGRTLTDAAQIIRGKVPISPKEQTSTQMKSLASEIKDLPQWRARRLVFERAVKLIER